MPVLTGLANESVENTASDSRRRTRAERAERRQERKEAARAKRLAAREARASTSQERREASAAKREAAHERRLESLQARREAAEERREASTAKREAARERYAAKVQARREAAEARREAAREKRELAKARRESARSGGEPNAAPVSASFASSDSAMPSGAGLASGGPGILRVNSLPWAQVFVDGRMVGYTPQRGISLTPGDHNVRLVNPSFQVGKTFNVRIAQGQQVTRTEVLVE